MHAIQSSFSLLKLLSDIHCYTIKATLVYRLGIVTSIRVMNLWILQKVGNFLAVWGTSDFSDSMLFHWVSLARSYALQIRQVSLVSQKSRILIKISWNCSGQDQVRMEDHQLQAMW